MPKLLCSPGDPEWLELRRTGITASDLPVIMGLVSWDSP
jgi:predicted phage-related endonuclease